MDRETHPPTNSGKVFGVRHSWSFGSWLRFCTVALAMQALPWIVLLTGMALMPPAFDRATALIATGTLALNLALVYGGLNLRLLRWCRLLTPASPALQTLVKETSARLGVQVRATWQLFSPDANAVAWINTRELAFTDKLLAEAPDDELRAICAHEVGHLSENRWVRVGRLAGAMRYFPFIFIRPAIDEFGGGGIAVIYFSFLALFLAKGRLARAMEKRADRIAVAHVEDPATYARALERLYRINQLPVVMKQSRTRPHPDLYDRMVAANVTPEYARPKPPETRSWSSIVLGVACVILAVMVFR